MEQILGIDPLHFREYSDPYQSSIDFLRITRQDTGVNWNPVLNSELTDMRAWSRDFQAFSRQHLRAKCGGHSVCVKQYAAGDVEIKDEVERLWRVRGSSHVLKFYGIVVKERDTYLVFEAPKFTLEEFWKIDKNPAWFVFSRV
jgi:hypothetical protein